MGPPRAAPLRQDSSSGPGCGDVHMSCSDLLRNDSLSITGSRKSGGSQEDDVQSVAASSVMSLLQRVQFSPLEKDWVRSCASGNASAQRVLLQLEPSLVHKKTGLHWAAKLGLHEIVELMVHSGADVNARSGYTALHLASIHGHCQIVLSLVNSYSAKTNIRDYHGKMAAQYWSESEDVFHHAGSQTVADFVQRRRTQRYKLPARLLSRSRSHENLQLHLSLPRPSSQEEMDSCV